MVNRNESRKTKNIWERLFHYDIPEQYHDGRSELRCNYCCGFYVFIIGLCFIMWGLIWTFTVHKVIFEREYWLDRIGLVIFFALVGLAFFITGCMFVSFIRNWTVIFVTGGIWYRNQKGISYLYSDKEVEGYLVTEGKHRYIMVKCKDEELISIGGASKNYQEALNLVQQRYEKL